MFPDPGDATLQIAHQLPILADHSAPAWAPAVAAEIKGDEVKVDLSPDGLRDMCVRTAVFAQAVRENYNSPGLGNTPASSCESHSIACGYPDPIRILSGHPDPIQKLRRRAHPSLLGS